MVGVSRIALAERDDNQGIVCKSRLIEMQDPQRDRHCQCAVSRQKQKNSTHVSFLWVRKDEPKPRAPIQRTCTCRPYQDNRMHSKDAYREWGAPPPLPRDRDAEIRTHPYYSREIPIKKEGMLHFSGAVADPDPPKKAWDEEALLRMPPKRAPWAEDLIIERPKREKRVVVVPPPPVPKTPPKARQRGLTAERLPASDVRWNRPAWFDQAEDAQVASPPRWSENQHLKSAARTAAMQKQILKVCKENGLVGRRPESAPVERSRPTRGPDLYGVPEAMDNPAMARMHAFRFVSGPKWVGGKHWNVNYHGKGVKRGRLLEDKAGKEIRYVE